MNWFLGVTVGAVVGLATGLLAKQVPMPALAQTIAAVLAAWVATTILVIWVAHRLRLPGTADVYYFIDLNNLAYLLSACAVAAILHIAIGVVATPGWLVANRSVCLAVVTGLFVGISDARVRAWIAQLPPMVEL